MGRHAKKNSIANIANEAGVSAFAVSCVINNRPGVSDVTRQKIQKILNQVGYSRNYKLSSGRTIGLVLPGTWDSWYISSLVRGVLAFSSESDCNVVTIIQHPDRRKPLMEELRKHSCDAVIVVMPCYMLSDIESVADKTDIPIILMDSNLRDMKFASDVSDRVGYVDNNSYQGSFDMCSYLIGLNHRRIAFISRSLGWKDNNQEDRIRGWRDAMRGKGMSEAEVEELLFLGYTNDIGDVPFKEKSITAVMCTDDYMAMSCLRYCYEKQIRVPDELTVTGFGNMTISCELCPPLTTVDQNTAAVGYKAAKYAYDLVTGKRRKAPNVVVSTELVIRKSSREFK